MYVIAKKNPYLVRGEDYLLYTINFGGLFGPVNDEKKYISFPTRVIARITLKKIRPFFYRFEYYVKQEFECYVKQEEVITNG